MMRGLGFSIVAVLALSVFAVFPATAQAAGLNGIWLGSYGYDDSRPSVKFQAKLSSDGASVSGSTVEANTFGNASAYFLTATLNGVLGSGGSVHFIKTYDGTGGQTHSVDYSGVFDASGQCVKGRWALGDVSGPFQICADARLLS